MKRVVRVLLVCLLVGALWMPLLVSSVASAATGAVSWTNPPENKGRILDSETGEIYQYNVNAGHTNPTGWEPNVGTRVTFTPGEGHTATDVTIHDDPSGG